MPTIESSLEIAASQAALFDLAQSYSLRLEWDPFLKAIRFPNGEKEAIVGTRVWVKAKNGLTMDVRYITFQAPSHVAMTMTEGPWVFEKFSGAWTFKALEGGRTRVVFKYHFTGRPALLRAIVEPVVSRVLKRDMDARLAALRDPLVPKRSDFGRLRALSIGECSPASS